jgi:LPXTG-motif cell wall-anchored protein
MKKLIIAAALLLASIATLIAPAAPAFASTTIASSTTPIILSEVQTDASGNKFRTISQTESTSSTSAGTAASSIWAVKVDPNFTNIMYLKNNTILLFGNVPATDTVAGHAILALYSTKGVQIGTTIEDPAGTILDEILLGSDNSTIFALKRTPCEGETDKKKAECRVLYRYEANTKSGLILKWNSGIPTVDLSSLSIAASATLKLTISTTISNHIALLSTDGSVLAYFKIADGSYYNAKWSLTCEAAADKKFSVTLPKISALVNKTATIKSITIDGKAIATANYKLGDLSTGLITLINSTLSFDAKTEHRLEITLNNGEKYLTTFKLGGSTACTAATDATTQDNNGNTSTSTGTGTTAGTGDSTSTSVGSGSSSSSASTSSSTSTTANNNTSTSANSTNNAELPHTGPATSVVISVLGLAALAAATAYYINSRKNHTAALKLPSAANISAKFQKIPETIYSLLDKFIK